MKSYNDLKQQTLRILAKLAKHGHGHGREAANRVVETFNRYGCNIAAALACDGDGITEQQAARPVSKSIYAN